MPWVLAASITSVPAVVVTCLLPVEKAIWFWSAITLPVPCDLRGGAGEKSFDSRQEDGKTYCRTNSKAKPAVSAQPRACPPCCRRTCRSDDLRIRCAICSQCSSWAVLRRLQAGRRSARECSAKARRSEEYPPRGRRPREIGRAFS